MEPAFSSILLSNPNADTFEIWRIRKLKLITLPEASYGKFYDGDSYIIFSRKNREAHIHFWLGTYTSQDEATVAAYKTVELDNYLDGYPVQHRESQGCESKRFLSYFKNYRGIMYLNGGFDTGLSHFERSLVPKLFLVKGKRDPIIIKQIVPHCWSEMNSGDVYVLKVCSETESDCIFVWRGRTSNFYEKLNGIKLGSYLKEETPSAKVVVLDDQTEAEHLSHEELKMFESVLPLDEKAQKLKDSKITVSDDDIQYVRRKEVAIYDLEKGINDEVVMTRVDVHQLNQKLLQSKKAYIIDDHLLSGIWVWVGKESPFMYRNEGLKAGQGYIKEKNYLANISITKIVQNTEPVEFRIFFKNWKIQDVTQSQNDKRQNDFKKLPPKFDTKAHHNNKPSMASYFRMVDDASGEKEVFRIEKGDLVPVSQENYGLFYSGDCYDERGIAAWRTVELDDKYGGKPDVFKILMGGISSKFNKGEEGVQNENENQHRLLHVRGTNKLLVRAVEVECSALSLNTNDCFILETNESKNFIWYGKCSIGDEREISKSYLFGKDYENIYEGLENKEFWNFLGGEQSYENGSNASGQFIMEEIFDFNQRDLIPDDVMLLDVEDCLYIWIGSQSNELERRDLEIPIAIVKQGEEPLHFRGFFDDSESSDQHNKSSGTQKVIITSLNDDNINIDDFGEEDNVSLENLPASQLTAFASVEFFIKRTQIKVIYIREKSFRKLAN
ncbi:VIL1 [Lepeophtheirus salmonis]|uniref:VIL1 n=1 Tax=Lepeophtheirus salmonis TaxID=72036 RepID=A0A7R8CJE3_LEPSM|nr:VIL1 [Lepeophtheirus salmonis]CAF2841103.1 VIL1 [Lepeophtheirus salmonis]